MRQPSLEEKQLINRIDSKWTEISNGLMQFTGTIKPLLMLEFQGYLDYLKLVEQKISFWEIKSLEVDHQVGPYYLKGRILKLKAKADLEIFTPGFIGPLLVNLLYTSDNQEKKDSLSRWHSIINEL